MVRIVKGHYGVGSCCSEGQRKVSTSIERVSIYIYIQRDERTQTGHGDDSG
jgi:hypothetical protein